MAMGDSYNGNTDSNKRQFKSPEVYSPYNTSNENGIDPSALSYSFWSGCLKIAIAPKLKNASDRQKWDYKNAATIYLTHRSARMFHQEILKVLDGKQESGSVKSGDSGLITFSNGKEFGHDKYCLSIRDIDSTGTIKSTYIYEFRTQFHYGIVDFKSDTSKFERDYYDTIEIDEILDVLETFYKSMTKATAYTVIDEMKYDVSRTSTKLGLIADALGVEFKGGNGSGNRGGSSYFDNNSQQASSSEPNRSVSRQATLDSIGGAMNPPEDD